MNNYTSFFDIETGPLPFAQIEHLRPEFTAPANYKDPQKIAEYVAAAQAKWLEQAALSPVTGKVLAIGLIDADRFRLLDDEIESDLIDRFWAWMNGELNGGREIVGWCCHHFDLPFLIKRSWKLGVQVPNGLRVGEAQQYWHPNLIDLQKRWQLGERDSESSLDIVAKYFGMAGKNGDGAEFARLWEDDRQEAIIYLENDLRLTRGIYERMML